MISIAASAVFMVATNLISINTCDYSRYVAIDLGTWSVVLSRFGMKRGPWTQTAIRSNNHQFIATKIFYPFAIAKNTEYSFN